MHPEITWKSWLMVAALGMTWGGTFMVVEIALRGITPFWLAAGRIWFATLLMMLIWGRYGFHLFKDPPTAKDWRALAATGVLSSTLPFALISWGLQYVTSGFTGVCMATVALIVLPLAHFLIPGERMTLRRSLGLTIGFVGVCVLIGASAFESSGTALEWPGRAACLAAAACYAISSVMVRQLPQIDAVGLSTVLLAIGAITILPLAILMEGAPPLPDNTTIATIAALGLIPTAAANLLRILVIRSAGPVFMSLTNYQVPVWAVILGALVLGEPLPATLMLALLLILSGVCLSQWGALRRLFAKRPI